MQEAYNQVVVLQLKDVRDAVETLNADIRRLEAETLAAAGPSAIPPSPGGGEGRGDGLRSDGCR